MTITDLTGQVIAAGMQVHSSLGPGLLESVYEACLCHELECHGLQVKRQHLLDIRYGSLVVPNALRIDILVEGSLVLEVKAVEQLQRLHTAQVYTYLRLSGLYRGLILNFNVEYLKEGIRRVTNFRSAEYAAQT